MGAAARTRREVRDRILMLIQKVIRWRSAVRRHAETDSLSLNRASAEGEKLEAEIALELALSDVVDLLCEAPE